MLDTLCQEIFLLSWWHHTFILMSFLGLAVWVVNQWVKGVGNGAQKEPLREVWKNYCPDMMKGRKKQRVYNPCHGWEQLILTQRIRMLLCCWASAKNGGREAQHTSFGDCRGHEVLSDLLCVKHSLISQQFTSGFVEFTLHSLHSHWCSPQPERHVLCTDTLSTHTTVQARQTCHFPHSYCYRLPKYMSYLLIIGCPVPGGVLSK